MITHDEQCKCKAKTIEFTSEFDKDVIPQLYCPKCIEKAPKDAVVFELCEPGKWNGIWAVEYDKKKLKKMDKAFRDDEDYYLSLLISGVVGPTIARNYKMGGLCRIFGYKGAGITPPPAPPPERKPKKGGGRKVQRKKGGRGRGK